MKRALLHHGSPGNAEDLDFLSSALSGYELRSVNRYGRYFNGEAAKDESSEIHVGYSFGSCFALKGACASAECKAVLLIAPFFPVKKSLSIFFRVLLKSSFFRRVILPNLARKSIETMLVQSSSPVGVPEPYRRSSQKYFDGDALAASILEKVDVKFDLPECLRILRARKVPIFVLVGAQDQTSYQGDLKKIHLDPLKMSPSTKVRVLESAGHALLWTHTHETETFVKEILEDL